MRSIERACEGDLDIARTSLAALQSKVAGKMESFKSESTWSSLSVPIRYLIHLQNQIAYISGIVLNFTFRNGQRLVIQYFMEGKSNARFASLGLPLLMDHINLIESLLLPHLSRGGNEVSSCPKSSLPSYRTSKISSTVVDPYARAAPTTWHVRGQPSHASATS